MKRTAHSLKQLEIGDSMRLFALQAIAEQHEQIRHLEATFTARMAVESITDGLRATYAQNIAQIPPKHPARACLNKASAALNSLDLFVAVMNEHGDDDTARSPLFRRLLAEGISYYTVVSGRWVERAAQALGQSATDGYLSDGIGLEGDDMQQVRPLERPMLNLYRKASAKAQDEILVFAQALVRE